MTRLYSYCTCISQSRYKEIAFFPPFFLLIHCKLTWHCTLFQSLNKLKQYKTKVEKLIISSSLLAIKNGHLILELVVKIYKFKISNFKQCPLSKIK